MAWLHGQQADRTLISSLGSKECSTKATLLLTHVSFEMNSVTIERRKSPLGIFLVERPVKHRHCARVGNT